ncbi:hypothetical protein ANN_16862 [Periplaneta americana]|uniref:Uncharacterized protein n=1 Tax=Periplaneta americana TaxID=6978 RepID=A0ABQ8SSN5_PERAM|nr:hypothetical protein ANN_16862 [Periplaneta americana]
MSPGSSTESYPAFARIGLRKTPEKTSTRCGPLRKWSHRTTRRWTRKLCLVEANDIQRITGTEYRGGLRRRYIIFFEWKVYILNTPTPSAGFELMNDTKAIIGSSLIYLSASTRNMHYPTRGTLTYTLILVHDIILHRYYTCTARSAEVVYKLKMGHSPAIYPQVFSGNRTTPERNSGSADKRLCRLRYAIGFPVFKSPRIPKGEFNESRIFVAYSVTMLLEKSRITEALKLNGLHQLLVYADDVNMSGKKKHKRLGENTGILLFYLKQVMRYCRFGSKSRKSKVQRSTRVRLVGNISVSCMIFLHTLHIPNERKQINPSEVLDIICVLRK